jgi:hypothetical protein
MSKTHRSIHLTNFHHFRGGRLCASILGLGVLVAACDTDEATYAAAACPSPDQKEAGPGDPSEPPCDPEDPDTEPESFDPEDADTEPESSDPEDPDAEPGSPDPEDPDAEPDSPVLDGPPDREPQPEPMRALCVVGSGTVAECAEDDPMFLPCTPSFEEACVAAGGTTISTPETTEPLPETRTCANGSSLWSSCDAEFQAACANVAGVMLMDREEGWGRCALDVVGYAESQGYSTDTVQFFETVETIEVEHSYFGDHSTVDVTLRNAVSNEIGRIRYAIGDTAIRLEASFDDGELTTFLPLVENPCMTVDIVIDSAVPADELWERTGILAASMPEQVPLGFLECLGSVALSVGACSPASLASGVGTVACGGAAILAACACFEEEIEANYGDVC